MIIPLLKHNVYFNVCFNSKFLLYSLFLPLRVYLITNTRRGEFLTSTPPQNSRSSTNDSYLINVIVRKKTFKPGFSLPEQILKISILGKLWRFRKRDLQAASATAKGDEFVDTILITAAWL